MVIETPHVPDILETLAQLPNDEVFTPPALANAMLDILPEHVWSEPGYHWLDPVAKSGVFLREIAKRLMVGLAEWELDPVKRREHVYRNMLYGAAISELTGEVARRSLYHSKDATGAGLTDEHLRDLIVKFDHADGNIPFARTEHTFKNQRCATCGAPADLERGNARENYAYPFIHGTYPTKELSEMKFDVIVGNPPYQLGSSGGNSKGSFAMPIYQKFVEQAMAMNPRHIVMITPSRWFAGGRSLDEYRGKMLADNRIRVLVDFPNAEECFPGADVSGGVSYFLWERSYRGPCQITTILGGQVLGETVERNLDEHDVFVRYNIGADIIRRVWKDPSHAGHLSEKVSPIQPFSLRTHFKGAQAAAGLKHSVGVWGSSGYSYIEYNEVPRNLAWVDQWKVLLGRAYGDRGTFPYKITSAPTVLPPGTACTETYLVVDRFENEEEARRFATYLSTRFVRFLISLRKYTQDIYNERFAFVPDLEMDREWTDADLYARYGLTEEEIAFIEYQVKPVATQVALL